MNFDLLLLSAYTVVVFEPKSSAVQGHWLQHAFWVEKLSI